VNKCVGIFKEYYDQIMAGEFEGDLISKIDGIEHDGLTMPKMLQVIKFLAIKGKLK